MRLTDTTFRDGNQSLLGGHLRGEEIFPIAKKMDGIGFVAMEAFGGATFETYLKMGEDPWEYLRKLRKATPNTPLQALIRGQNLVGHHNFADDTVELFIRYASRTGVDVFRVFDPLNDLRNMEAAIRAAHKAKRRVQGALSYAISPAHDLDLWCSLAKGLADMGVEDIVIKDTSGLLSPQVTWELVDALNTVASLPVVVHSHCSSGMAPMAYMAAVEAGAAVLDTALSPLAWGASQPATESVVAALAGGDYATGLDLERLVEIKIALEALKEKHLEHLSPLADRVDSDILRFQMPQFMLQDIHRQLHEHGAEDRLRDALQEVPRVRQELGYPPLVAPVRQLIATQAVYNVISGDRYATVTQELKDYLQGLYGQPPWPADSELRRQILGREEPITIRPADLLEPQVEAARAQVKKLGRAAGDGDVLIYLMFPALSLRPEPDKKAEVARENEAEEVPPPAAEPASASEAPPAQEPAGAGASSPGTNPPPPAPPAAEFEVEVEGEIFKVRVSGGGIAVAPAPASAPAAGGGEIDAAPTRPQPQAQSKPGAVSAPMQGLIVRLPLKVGEDVKLGDVVAVLEAMKMQNDIVATQAGKVTEIYVEEGQVVAPNQAILHIG